MNLGSRTRGPRGGHRYNLRSSWETSGPNTDGGPPRRWDPSHLLRSPLLPAEGPRAPPRSAPGRREAWPARANLQAVMASVVEYKGLKAGYRCGYCDSEEGKASCGEWSGQRGRRGRLANKPPQRPPRFRLGPRGGGSTQALLPSSRFPSPRVSSQTAAFHILSVSPLPKMAVSFGERAEIAEGCPRSRWRRRLQRRGRSRRG